MAESVLPSAVQIRMRIVGKSAVSLEILAPSISTNDLATFMGAAGLLIETGRGKEIEALVGEREMCIYTNTDGSFRIAAAPTN